MKCSLKVKNFVDNKTLHYFFYFFFYYIDESFTLETIHCTLSKMKNEEYVLSSLYAQAHEDRLEDCLKSHPCLSWSVLISMLLRARRMVAANYILQNYEFNMKGYL